MNTKIFIFLIALTLILLPHASAIDTEINVRTLPNHKISILVIKVASQYELLKVFNQNSDSLGRISVLYTGDESEVRVNVQVSRENGPRIILEKFEPLPAGAPLYLQVIPGNVSNNYKALDEAAKAAEQNETEEDSDDNETTELSENVSEGSTSAVTGFSVSGEKTKISKTTYYIIGAVFVLAFLVIFSVRMRQRFRDPAYSYKPIKLQMKEETPKRVDAVVKDENINAELLEAEKKIKEAQATINKIKNEEKIREAERRLTQDQEMLEKLKRGED